MVTCRIWTCLALFSMWCSGSPTVFLLIFRMKSPMRLATSVSGRSMKRSIRGTGALTMPEIAELVQRALLRFDGERYSLLAWCVMPNHVHALIESRPMHRLDRVVHSWKSFTAHAANKLLGRTTAFWAPEYFDRYMRDDMHFAATLAYIETTPVKAGLCREPREWAFSSASRR